MHDSDSGGGINSGISQLFAGIGIGIKITQRYRKPGLLWTDFDLNPSKVAPTSKVAPVYGTGIGTGIKEFGLGIGIRIRSHPYLQIFRIS